MLEHALGYAHASLPVIPLSGKVPLTTHGKDDATTDPKVIRAWWTRWPHANIGVRPPEGIVVLDVDPRNGGDIELARLEERHGRLPQTLTCRTGSGGLHIWLAYYGPTRGKLGPGIDVKRHTGYLVAPPSVHPGTGLRYEWLDTLIGTAPAVAWVRLLLNPPPPAVRKLAVVGGGKSLDHLVRFVLDDPGSELNNRLYWASVRAHEAGLDTADLVEAAVSKGHPRRAAEKTANSAANAPRRRSA